MGGVCSCRVGRGSQVNAGSILDRVISQASNEDQCLLYRLANYKKGGELIEAYNQGGQPEVEKLIREQFGILMYADGKGQTINRAEYLRWKFRDLEQVVLPIEASLSQFDPLAQWNDHEACWQMQYRGSLGETLLHVLIICDTRMHTRIARIMLKCFPRLAIDVVEGEEYLGAGALHLAIAYNNNELVQDLVEAGAIISQRAIGSFFLPRDQQRMNPARNTDYEGLAYLGEYPLAWAACCANESVYNLLLDSGADPDEQDSFGNMILHMVVVGDKLLQFLKRLIILVFHLASLSLAVYFRPAGMEAVLLQWPEEITDVVRTAAECITVLGVLNYILVQLGGEMVNIGPLSFLKQLSHEPAKLIFVISNLLILACIPCRIAGDRHAEDAILVYAVPGSWFLLMFFAGAIRLTGPFVTMVYSMITGDMLTFGIIYTVMLFGFSQSFYFLYKGFPGVKSSLYHSYPSTWMALFQITLGDYNYADLSNTTYPNLSKAVFAIFMVLVPILLLNMLIAMMGNTYAHVIEQSEKEFVKQWAKIVVSLERAVSQKDAHNYLQEYSIKLGPGDDPNNPVSEQRGVLVIKSKSKTKAKQRKGAVANWKRVGKVTIHELRKRGMTGEELRRIMWGRASFSTPVRVSPNADQPQVSAVTAGFGDALTAALDVMAFAHDFDLSTATEGIPTNIDAKQIKTTTQSKAALNEQQTKTTPDNPAAVASVQPHKQPIEEQTKLSGLTDLVDKSIDPAKDVEAMNVKNTNQTKALKEAAEDPFLELAIASESAADYKTLLQMAKSALATSEASMKTTIDPQILAHFAMVAPPTAEKSTIVKKQYFIESSDNDLGGSHLLGTEARLRRIKSANNRYNATSKRPRRVDDDDSSSSTTSVERSQRYRPLLNDPEERPANRDETEGRNTAVETIKQEVKQNGGIPTKPPDKIQKRRPKTAKNRVSPKEIEEPARRRESIERNKAASPPTSSSDPLEPWSTRGITDMNTILAWRENAPDSP
ncbi:PREDICTED: uncharacterized protein LOC105559855 isoform X3 [Vollenhovia emeryi]|uniref:uncharacterized protein LOC105559855 isoform X3 n=1 Tax=Vollenhovia emeryi TaxID=411798 RepID=UPI0005F47FA9|nr:PREDICTED: uncharacterized protein LOC105559855 isoform X3 [Vollenhovia emeryi]